MTIPTLPAEFESGGVIGDRSLRTIQLLRIGRHTSRPVPVPREGILVVSGRGPEAGSNGAGKTVFVGAISLLNGDAQWRGSDGIGPNAARLLFDQNRARVNDSRFADALHGYIAGVYMKPGRVESAITVWMRIERHAPDYVQVRWTQGVRLAAGDAEKVRLTAADTVWNELRGSKTLRVGEYAETLFGSAPRCVAYIRARGSEENQDRGLLALGQRQFRPADLADQIINLAGKRQAVENERDFRIQLAAADTQLDAKQKLYEIQRERFNSELKQIDGRKDSRNLLAAASTSWARYLVIGAALEHREAEAIASKATGIELQIDTAEGSIAEKSQELKALTSRAPFVERLAKAKTEQKRADGALESLVGACGACELEITQLEQQQANLQNALAGSEVLLLEEAQAALETARGRLIAEGAEKLALENLKRNKTEHVERLRAGRGGPSGSALEALAAEGIEAFSILDFVTLEADDRAEWEARLSPYESTIVLESSDLVTLQRAKRLLADHPGVPVMAGLPLAAVSAPGNGGVEQNASLVEGFLNVLERRMPRVDVDWVADADLGIEIRGGFSVPLTDRQAVVAAAEAEIAEVDKEIAAAVIRIGAVEQAVTVAEKHIKRARDRERLSKVVLDLPVVVAKLGALQTKRDSARTALKEANEELGRAEGALATLDERRETLTTEINDLKHGQSGTVALRFSLGEVRTKLRARREAATAWKDAAGVAGVDYAEALLAADEVEQSSVSRDAAFQEARTHLRHAIAAVHSVAPGQEPTEEVTSTPGAGELNQKLNSGLTSLHRWCETHQTVVAAKFESVSRPLVEWLEWNGADDHTREEEIHAEQIQSEQEIESARRSSVETHAWIESQRDTQIAVITQAFKDTESTLNELLDTVGKDRVRLGIKHTDVRDTELPLRWELRPQWLPREGKPVDYTNPPNTAELIILHVLLATAALVSATRPRGRMLILDESGNNLDSQNLSKISAVLQQISKKHGLTVVLACQDIYTDRVSRYGAASIQLLRHSTADALNAPPTLIFDIEEPEVFEALWPYINVAQNGLESDASDAA